MMPAIFDEMSMTLEKVRTELTYVGRLSSLIMRMMRTPLGRTQIAAKLYRDRSLFIFEHDGAPFSLQELSALLSGGSSKEFESEETTGRFGTGFL